LSRRHFLGQLSRDEIELEFRNQISKFTDQGLTPTHLDTHKHIHSLSTVLDAMIVVAHEFNIGKMRFPTEHPVHGPGKNGAGLPRPSLKTTAKRNLIRFFCYLNRKRLDGTGMISPDHFIGIDYMDVMDSGTLLAILPGLQCGTTEIMCHPGFMDDELRRYSRIPPYREQELNGLIDPEVRGCVMENDIKLISYNDLQ